MKLPADVAKTILAEGRLGPKDLLPPYPDGTKVDFNFKTCIVTDEGVDVEGPALDDTRCMAQPMTLIIGKQFKMPVWELMVHTMIPGQVARFVVPKHYVTSYPMVSKAIRESASGERSHTHHCCGMMSQGIGFPDLDKLMQAPQDLSFLFELLSVSPPGGYERETWQLTESEKLASVPLLQTEGNALFSGGDFRGAERKYFTAISHLEQLILKEHPSSSEAKELESQKVPLLLNYALCLMKRDEVYEAITHLDTALKLQPDNVKGYFRRGQCHQSVGDYREARSDFAQALQLDPSLHGTVATLEQQMVAEQRRRDEVDKNKYKRIFQEELAENKGANNNNNSNNN
ncbi:AH receptor-interacting protein [Folsomia candida]|uniref:AH receptor-interacting protein n=1 Tax=Folsomia candida TaxID=158441 RepID=A0A226F3G5_FOLCA|nr:AH receptor-interacting protein [Folsomia candida]XP_021950401.1 AH receptor-interacting protein [Folsomia candida]OXA63900.1 AH receptor-interacting protein [Folsomia candida]